MRIIPNLIFLIMVFISQSVVAEKINLPVSHHNNANPFVKIHGLQGFSGVNQLNSGELTRQLMLEIDNEFFNKLTENEQVKLDYERTTLNFNLAYGVNETWSIGLEIPYMINSGGFLDGLIENWHDLFGLNQGGRDTAEENEFFISYNSGNQSLTIDDTDQGIGDISIYADRSLVETPAYRLGLRAKLKIPTGDENQLFGSGGYAGSLHFNTAVVLSERLTTFAAAGFSYLSKGDVLKSQQKNLIAIATLGLAWQFSSDVLLSAQFDLNSKIYADTDLSAVSGQAGVLYASAKYNITDKASLQIGITEDVINKDGAPDFGIRLGYTF